jgi:hypothetical protein
MQGWLCKVGHAPLCRRWPCPPVDGCGVRNSPHSPHVEPLAVPLLAVHGCAAQPLAVCRACQLVVHIHLHPPSLGNSLPGGKVSGYSVSESPVGPLPFKNRHPKPTSSPPQRAHSVKTDEGRSLRTGIAVSGKISPIRGFEGVLRRAGQPLLRTYRVPVVLPNPATRPFRPPTCPAPLKKPNPGHVFPKIAHWNVVFERRPTRRKYSPFRPDSAENYPSHFCPDFPLRTPPFGVRST